MKLTRLFFALLLIGSWSCTDEPSEDAPAASELVGYWLLDQATRSGQPTESLEGLFFEFSEQGVLTSNLSGTPMASTYELDDARISHTMAGISSDFYVQSLSDSMLVLTSEMRNYPFVFTFKRVADTTHTEGHGEEI